MRAGTQTELVQFYRKVQTSDGGGGYTEVPMPVRAVWGCAEYSSATDAIVSQQIEGRQRLMFTCPYSADLIDATLVAQFQDRWYRVFGPPKNKGFRNRELEIVLEELQASSGSSAV